MQPEAFEIRENGAFLRIRWNSSRVSDVAAAMLWDNCPSAQAKRRRLDGRAGAAPSGLTIQRIEPIGRYGLNIAFSDGNDRGIYPWSMLAALAARPRMEDFIIAAHAGAA